MKILPKLTLLFFTLILVACGGSSPRVSSDENSSESPAPDNPVQTPQKIGFEYIDATGNEASDITFKVKVDSATRATISFSYNIDFPNNLRSGQTASQNDLNSPLTDSSQIKAGDSSTTISIAIVDDNIRESAETFKIILSNASPANTIFDKNIATGTILANDPQISISDATSSSESKITFTVTSSQQIAKPINFKYKLVFDNPLTKNSASTSDFSSGEISGEKTITANSTDATIVIALIDDIYKESAETFQIQLSDLTPSEANFTNLAATGTILASDSDGVKTNLRISDGNPTEANEGGNITFTVTSEPAIAEQVSFSYNLVFDNPITKNSASTSDFSSREISGEKTITANSNSTTISIAISDDNFKEQSETFQIQLSELAPSEATFTKRTATGAIATSDSDKATTSLTIANAQGSEGGNISFTVTSAQAIAEQISFDYQVVLNNPLTSTSANTSDFAEATTGSGTIATNDLTATISIAIKDDLLREPDETFMVMLSNLSPSDATFTDNIGIGTISENDNDGNGIVTISVANAQASEASSTINFQVTSEFPAILPFAFDYEATLDNTLTNSASGDDFIATSGRATILNNQNSTTISIHLTNDVIAEQDEIFKLQISNPSNNATLDNRTAAGTILDDDLGAISDATAIIGDTEITLNWTNPDSTLFAGVTIAQATGTAIPNSCNPATNVTIIDALQTESRTIDNLTNGSTYSFRICARSTSGIISKGVALTNLTPLPSIDNDGDGLIDIIDATGLNNIRYNLAGTSYKTNLTGSSNAVGCPNNVCNGYELMNDITLSGQWTAIGKFVNKGFPFTAIFEGNNNTISNLTINDHNGYYIGLFVVLTNATVSNLNLANVSINGAGNIGALTGMAFNSTFSNIELIGDNSQSSSDAEIKGSRENIGGLVGHLRGTITDSSSSLTVRGGANVIGNKGDNTGGLVGNFISGLIKNSNSSGAVFGLDGGDNIGGLVGNADSEAKISQSWASGAVSSNKYSHVESSWNYGGLVGQSRGSISQSWASGTVFSITHNNNYGGLVGLNRGKISQSWTSGQVLSADYGNYGGLVGQSSGSISQSWASGQVLATFGHIGGLVGNNASNINGRNYQLDDATGTGVDLANDDGIGISFALGSGADNNDATGLRALAALSGDVTTANTPADWRTKSGWHAGFDIDNTTDGDNNSTGIDLETRFCDTNGNGTIDVAEQVATNSVWVMAGGDPSNDSPPAPDGFYRIPAIRCIANTADATNDAEIDRLRKIEIDRQRRLFAK